MTFNKFEEYTETLRHDELLAKTDACWDAISDDELAGAFASGESEYLFLADACKRTKPGDIVELNHTTMKFEVVGHYEPSKSAPQNP